MNNGKNFLRIILFLILFIPSYFAVYNIWVISSDQFTVENTTKIEIKDKVDGEVLAEYTNGADIKSWIKTLENAQPVSTTIRDLIYEQPLILTFYKGLKTFSYGLYLSVSNTNDCIIKTFDNELLHMQQADAEKILNTPLSDTLYPNNNLPVGKLVQGEEIIDVYPNGGEWELKKPNGNFYPSTVPNKIKAANKVKDYQSKPFDITFPVQPDMLTVEVVDNKEMVYSDIYGNFIENFSSDIMKDLEYTLTAEWYKNETNDFYGSATYVFDVRYYVPAKFEISAIEADPGDIVAVTAYNLNAEEKLSIAADTDMGFEPKFVSLGTNRIALIPIGYNLAGKKINLTLTSESNEPLVYHIKINEKEFKSRNVGAMKEREDIHLSPAAQSAKKERYNAIFGVQSADEKYWTDNKFIMPRVAAKGTADFWLEYGWKITVNGANAYINNGVNIDIDPGDPVKASNAGKVIFTGELPEDGNVIVIDHGLGVKTWYGHLNKIDVKKDDGVLKGQQIGTMGMGTAEFSGLFTDIKFNVFFAVSVNNVFVDPVSFIANGIPGIDTINMAGYGNLGNDMPEASAVGDNNNMEAETN